MSDPVRTGRPEAAAAIWKAPGANDRARAAKSARVAASIRALVAGLLGAGFIQMGHLSVGLVASSIAVITLVLGLVSPLGAYAAVDRAVLALGRGVGGLLTWLLLAPFFFLILAPFGLLTKRGKRDPLERQLDRRAETYWQDRDGPRDLDTPY